MASVAILCGVLLFLTAVPQGMAIEGAQTFAFVDAGHIITVESAGEHTFVVNFINLTDFVIVVQPADFIYRSASGQHYIGQVYELEHQDSLGKAQKYSASILLKGHSFAGLNIVGLFREKNQIEELSVRLSSRRFYLQALEKTEFEELVRKIEDLDLNSSDVAAMYEGLNIRGIGSVESADGPEEWEKDWEGLILDGVNPPRAIVNPPFVLPDEAVKFKKDGSVRLSCIVTKNGGARNLKVVKGVQRDLDEKILEVVANSWEFLPATKNGEVYESLLEFNVPFAVQSQSQ